MDLYDKIRKIEALIERASSEGERQAAQQAKRRLQKRVQDSPIEYRVSTGSKWEKRLFVAICKKNGLHTYRYRRQKYTTTMLRVSKTVMDNVLWPEYQRYAQILREMVDEIAKDLTDKIYHNDEEETVISGEIASAH